MTDVGRRQTRRWRLLLAMAMACGAAVGPVPAHAEAGATVAADGVLHVREVQLATSQWNDTTRQRWIETVQQNKGTGRPLPDDLAPPVDAERWQEVSLPDVAVRGTVEGRDAADAVQMRWYRLTYKAPVGQPALGLYWPRVVAGSAVVLLHVADGWVPVHDNAEGWREQWVRPQLVRLPPLQAEGTEPLVFELVVALPAVPRTFYVVPSLQIGPLDGVQQRYRARWFWQITVPEATAMALLALGGFAFAFWLRRRHEYAYLLFALQALGWVLRNLHYHVDLPHDPMVWQWFWWMTTASLSWVMALMYLFALRFHPRRFRTIERGLMAFVLLASVAMLPLWPANFIPLVPMHVVNAAVSLFVTGFVNVLAWRGSRELRVMAAAMNVGVVLGMMDLLLLTGVAGPEHIYALPYATLVILVAFLYAVQRRYVQAVDEAEQATVVLAQRLAAQDAQLRAQHDRLREAENQQALWLERQRLMHDMHDGLGSALLSSLAAVERGAMAPPQVAEVLRQCADDLRLVIDSLEPIGHDVVTLLATLRYRLGPRLDAAGLKLQWRMGELPPLDWLEPPDALQVLRVVQEALTNVLKHAEAQHIRIEARTVDPHASGLAASQVEIEIADDGRGCAGVAVGSATPPAGRGVVGMRRRADRLGGSLDVHSGPNAGTRVVLRLPVQRTGKADQPNSAQDISPWSRGRHTS